MINFTDIRTKIRKITAAIVLLYIAPLVFLGSDLLKNRYQHYANTDPWQGIILVAVLLFLLIYEFNNHTSFQGKPGQITGYLSILSGLILNLIAGLSGILVFQGLSLILILSGISLSLGGWRLFLKWFIPLILIAYMAGIFYGVSSLFSYPLQLMATYVSGLTLNVLGYPTIWDGIYLYLPYIVLRVDPSCSGFNHITALMIISLVLAYKNRFPVSKSIFLIVFAAFLGIFLNSFRITLIGMWAEFGYINLLHGPGEILYISSVFVVGFFILIAISNYLPGSKSHSHVEGKEQAKISHDSYKKHVPMLLFLYLGTALIFFWPIKKVDYKENAELLKKHYENYHLQENNIAQPSLLDESIQSDFDYYDIKQYVNNDSDTLIIYLGYIGKQEQDKEVISYKITNLISGSRAQSLNTESGNIVINYKPHRTNGNSAIYSLFWSGYDYEDNAFKSKLKLIYNGLINQRTNGALVLIEARRNKNSSGKEIPEAEKNAIAQILVDLKHHLKHLNETS